MADFLAMIIPSFSKGFRSSSRIRSLVVIFCLCCCCCCCSFDCCRLRFRRFTIVLVGVLVVIVAVVAVAVVAVAVVRYRIDTVTSIFDGILPVVSLCPHDGSHRWCRRRAIIVSC